MWYNCFMLTNERILELASGKHVDKIAVENFLFSVDVNDSREIAVENAYCDDLFYKWNIATLDAILTGIYEHFTR